MRLVQGQMGIVLADYANRPDESGHRSRSRCRQARVRCDDADEKDRHRCNRGGALRLRLQSSKRACLLSMSVSGSAASVRADHLLGLALQAPCTSKVVRAADLNGWCNPSRAIVRPETVPVFAGLDGRKAGLFGTGTHAPQIKKATQLLGLTGALSRCDFSYWCGSNPLAPEPCTLRSIPFKKALRSNSPSTQS